MKAVRPIPAGLRANLPPLLLELSVPTRFSSIEDAVAAIARGEAIIVVDAEDRENEGDFIAAAEKATPELVNFMITHGRGQLCMPILPEVSERLKLPPVVETNTAPLGTAYTIPVDHRTAKPALPPLSVLRRFRPCATLTASRATLSDRDTSTPWSPRRGESSAAPGIPRPPSIWPVWLTWLLPACSARSSTNRAIGQTATNWPNWHKSTTCTSSRLSS